VTPPRLRTETVPVSKTLCSLVFLEYQMMEKVHKPSYSNFFFYFLSYRVTTRSMITLFMRYSKYFHLLHVIILSFLLPSFIYKIHGQNNGYTKLRNRICVGYNERTSVSNTECSSVCLHCSACVSALVNVLSDSPGERIGEWETCLILNENILLVRLLLEHL
jgi:hypothetical protein